MGLGLRRGIGAALASSALLLQAAVAQAQPQVLLPTLDVWATRTWPAIAGTATSVITAEDIARSPGESLQDVLTREAGIQTWNLFGGVNGAGSTVDLRGFGAAAGSNTLVLINGRRLNDIDMANVNFAAIPRDSIERIEITRGNSGGVLYGDNAVGGVINIVTKTAVGQRQFARIESGFGSFRRAEGNASVGGSSGPWAVSLYGSALSTDGYRVNNAARQHGGVADFRYTTPDASAYFTVTANDQRIGLPGARLVDPSIGVNLLETDRRGATTPFDYANTRGSSFTAGVTRRLWAGTELIVDGGLRLRNDTAAAFLGGFDNFLVTGLTTASITPRITSEHTLFGLPSKAIGGVDYYDSGYQQDRGLHQGDAPIHSYRLRQRTLAAYAQDTVALLPSTDLAFGARVQQNRLRASDAFDPTAPTAPFAFELAGTPLDKTETNKAWHVGLEHRFNDMVTVFGRLAQAFRTPNVDERVGSAQFGTPVDFNLRTQTSRDAEAGLRLRVARFSAQWTVYDMELKDELHFNPDTFTNTNLDPTRRYGSELTGSYQLTDAARLTAAAAYTRSIFREGPFAGNDVPLVSRWTGNVGASWDIWQKYLTFDGVVRYVGPRRMDNDQVNRQPMIPAHTVVDVRLGGMIDRFAWSIAVQNLFNVLYFDYAAASTFTLGRYNAYPLPGRTFVAKASATF